ncbi:YggT family protein [Microbacterium sp. 18062]|uniref:YggT family protein n=1 Tax=Microbacterium sp. 18062 TaxID=2681410 RepID=UPI0013593E20|nr:YggT family protein [Microbacterium sp. 18062]
MEIVRLVASIANVLLLIYILVLLSRVILEYIPIFNREWRPKGAGLVAAELVYTVTDPPIKLIRRFIPPVRIGPVALDVAFMLTMLLCFILLSVTRSLAS